MILGVLCLLALYIILYVLIYSMVSDNVLELLNILDIITVHCLSSNHYPPSLLHYNVLIDPYMLFFFFYESVYKL